MAVVAFTARLRPVRASASLPLGMAQLCPTGLSEQWVLRFCGDQHWALIAKALGQRSAVFHAADGRPVYAAFCATSLWLQRPRAPVLGRDVTVESALFAVSQTRTGSRHQLLVEGEVIAELWMISTFVSHDASGSNRRIVRSTVMGEMALPQAEDGLMRLDRQARDTVRGLRQTGLAGAREIHAERPTPTLDFNAVGLLYFPTFSRIAETAAFVKTGRAMPTLQRDVTYLGNIDQGEWVHVLDAGPRCVMTREDGTPIAAMRTLTAPV